MKDGVPTAYEDMMARAAELAAEERLLEAAVAYRQAATGHPDQPGPHYELGLLHHQQGEVPEAIACFGRAAALMPRDASIWNNLGVLHFGQGDHGKAEQCFRQAVALEPKYAEAWYGLGKASLEAGRRGDAVVAFGSCLHSQPDHARAQEALSALNAGAGKQRVGFISLWYERGQAYVTQMLRNVVATEYETFVLARNGGTADRRLLSSEGEWVVPNLTTHSEYVLPRDLLKRWIEENALGVVFFNEEYDLGLVQEARQAGARTIGIYYWELFDPAWAETVNALYDVVICPTRCSYERFRELGITRAVHVPWGVDTALFRPVDRPVNGKVRFFHPAGWGGLHARRGTQAVIDAFRAANLPDAELLVHTQQGEGVERHGTITIHHGTVPREQMVRMYQESDVAVLPSKWEGLGLTFLEAIGCGLPIITVDAPPMNEFVVNGETGLLCPVAERRRYEGIFVEGVEARIEELAGAMTRLDDRDLLAAMRASTLQRAPEYAWSRRSVAVLGIMNEVTEGEPSGPRTRSQSLQLPRKDYAGCAVVTRGHRRFVREGEHQEPATVHLVGARRSNFPWGMENEIYRSLELSGYRILDTDFRQEFGDLADKLQQPAHLLLAVKGNGIPPEFIRQQPCPTVLWYPDDIYAADHARPQLAYNGSAFDRVYTFDPCAIDEYRQLGMRDVRWLPLAASPALHRRMYLPKVYDVSFVGNVYPNRQRLLERLSQRFNLLVTRAYTDEMVRIFDQSKITLNLGIGPTGIQLRVFEALGCGCFLLTNEIPPESRLFTDREHLVYYRDSDIEDLIAYYLDHEEEREEIAHSGYLEVHARHTFAHRVKTILADAFGVEAEETDRAARAPHPAPVEVPRIDARPAARPAAAPAPLPPAPDQPFNVAIYAPAWNGEVDELAMVHVRALRSRGHTVTLNAIGDGCRAVVAYGDFQATEALAAAEAHRLPLYCYVLDIPTWRLDEPEHREHYWRYREVLRRCTEVMALSEQTRGMVREFAGRDARVCYLGFPMTELDLTQPEYDVDETFQIAFLSRLVPHKHPEVVIEALSHLEKCPRLVIMAKSGDRPLMEACQAQAHRLGVEVVFNLGLSTDEVARELRRSLFLVSASTFEGFGMSPGEALYCGKPAVVTDLPSFREAYRDYVQYFPAMDSRALAAEMAHLLENGAKRRWLGEQGHHYVVRHYTVAQAAQRLEGLLRTMDAHPPAPEAVAVAAPAPSARPAQGSPEQTRSVVRYVGPIYNVSGYGKACRLNILAIQNHAGADVLPLNLTPANMDYRGQEAQDVRAIEVANTGRDHDVNMFHCNLRAYTNLYEPRKRNIVNFLYESTVLERKLRSVLVSHDWDIIVNAQFVQDTLDAAGVPNPVHIVPLVFRAYESTTVDCIENLNGRLKFYTINNWTPRKNLQGLLRAYFKAFTEDDNVILLIKTFRLDYSRQQDELIMQEFAAIRREFSRPPLVCFLFGVWDEPHIARLHEVGDVFVSATHGEAWGLTGFEAMGYGKPVIQTCWSGMTDYMCDDCCYPVREGREDYYTIEKPYSAPVGEGDTWFYPDMDRFSELMRYCYQHPDEARAKGQAARTHIASRYSLQAIGRRFKEVLQS